MKQRRSGIVIVMGLLMLALIIYAAASLSRMNARIEDAELARDALADEALALAVSNASLEYEIEHSSDLDMVEKVARDKLGLVLPGEIIYYDIGS
jgi:cell division protein FtsB